MKSIIRTIFSQLGYEIAKMHPIEKKAKEIYWRYSDYTMIPELLFVDNLKLVWEFRDVEGSVVECGVWRGGMSAGIASILPKREFFLFDSFEGLPDAKEIDGKGALAWQSNKESPGYFNNCKAEVNIAERALQSTGVKFHLIKGWFNETLPVTEFKNSIAILRLDADWYESTFECLTTLYPLVSKGGIVIFDDYYTWDGCSRAVHDYLSQHSLTARLHKTRGGVPYLIKID